MLRFQSLQYLVLVSSVINHVFICSQVLDSSHLQPVATNNQQKAINIQSALLASNTERWCEVKHQWLIHSLGVLWQEQFCEEPGAVQKQSHGKAGTTAQLFLLPFQT